MPDPILVKQRDPRGLKPGQRHDGQFRKGFDARRWTPDRRYNGKSLPELARERTPECLALLESVVLDEEESMRYRMQAAIYLLEQGHGKPVALVDMTKDAGRNPRQMTDDELLKIAGGEVLEGEFSNVEATDDADPE